MAWIGGNDFLTEEQKQNNAKIVIDYFRNINVNELTIAALLGNMDSESTINPNKYEEDSSFNGYGLIQWSNYGAGPEGGKEVLINHCNAVGVSPYTSGKAQLAVIIGELTGISGAASWYTTEAFISNYYDIGATTNMIDVTGEEFLKNSKNFSLDELTILYVAGRLRPGTVHIDSRLSNAKKWLEFMGGYSPVKKKKSMPIWMMIKRYY